MVSVGEGEGGKIWENGIETCKISCMKKNKNKNKIKLKKRKCYTQYARKFGKFSSGRHRTGKGQFSFQSQRKAPPKTVQTTV